MDRPKTFQDDLNKIKKQVLSVLRKLEADFHFYKACMLMYLPHQITKTFNFTESISGYALFSPSSPYSSTPILPQASFTKTALSARKSTRAKTIEEQDKTIAQLQKQIEDLIRINGSQDSHKEQKTHEIQLKEKEDELNDLKETIQLQTEGITKLNEDHLSLKQLYEETQMELNNLKKDFERQQLHQDQSSSVLNISREERNSIIINQTADAVEDNYRQLWESFLTIREKIVALRKATNTHFYTFQDLLENLEDEDPNKLAINTTLQVYHNLASPIVQEVEEKINSLQTQYADDYHLMLSPLTLIKEVKESLLLGVSSLLKENQQTQPAPQDKEKPTEQIRSRIILLPKDKNSLIDIQRQIRVEIKNSTLNSLDLQIKTTQNQNIQITSTAENLQVFKQMVENSTQLSEKIELVEPDTRRRRILLLNVPDDIQEEELREDLESNKYFTDNDFTIVKSIKSRKQFSNNWQLETNAKDYRHLIRLKKLRISTLLIRVVSQIRIQKCTNCQCFEEHTAKNCKYASECGNCAELHHSSQCSNNFLACINCKRANMEFRNHSASSPTCPVFQEFKREKLSAYYSNQPLEDNNQTQNDVSSRIRPKYTGNPPNPRGPRRTLQEENSQQPQPQQRNNLQNQQFRVRQNPQERNTNNNYTRQVYYNDNFRSNPDGTSSAKTLSKGTYPRSSPNKRGRPNRRN